MLRLLTKSLNNIVLLAVLFSVLQVHAQAEPPQSRKSPGIAPAIVVDRKTRSLTVKDGSGKTIIETSVGIGRGGLGKKRIMNDYITPAGKFTVDLILYQPPFTAIDENLKKKYAADANAASYLGSTAGLQKLLGNMNSIDFNGDGKPDTAYGAGYIGLDSKDAVTGPKFSKFNSTDYWFSIALHGTAKESRNIGFANSGGCIQLPAGVLKQLIEKRIVQIGSELTIR